MFEDSLDPGSIVAGIEIRLNTNINLKTDLIFFDEIGECPKAVNSLKYFTEKFPTAYICASGSNIGLLDSFPVGKVRLLELFPLSFEEFLMAADREPLLRAFRKRAGQASTHEPLWKMLLDYYFVGGMPEAVQTWFGSRARVRERCRQIKQIHHDLIGGYVRDFGKYSGKVNAQHIEAVFLNVPRQLSSNMDGSVRRFLFKDVVEKKRRYAELRTPIDWLGKAKLISKCYPITGRPAVPLKTRMKENVFKLFFFDVGLLGYMLEMEYEDQQKQMASYKGYIAENFVQNELRATGICPTYSWEQARSQIEFLHRCRNGDIIPVEVKSGSRTRAKSLHSFVKRYQPSKTVKLIGGRGDGDSNYIVWPLYYAQFLCDL